MKIAQPGSQMRWPGSTSRLLVRQLARMMSSAGICRRNARAMRLSSGLMTYSAHVSNGPQLAGMAQGNLGVGVAVAVRVAVGVEVGVWVKVGVAVAVCVGVAVSVYVGVMVAVAVGVGVAVAVGSGV